MGTRHVPPSPRRVLGIDLGGAASATTGYARLEGEEEPALVEVGVLAKPGSPLKGEEALVELIGRAHAHVIAIDAPLQLPPCLRCSASCRGPGDACESGEAQKLWERGRNPVSQRLCELVVKEEVGERPLSTMQLGVITARAVALVRKLERSRSSDAELIEVYPRATLRRFGEADKRLLPKAAHEDPSAFRERVQAGMGDLVGGLDQHSDDLQSPHALDALVAAHTGWLHPHGLDPPPKDFDLGGGWIWVPKASTI